MRRLGFLLALAAVLGSAAQALARVTPKDAAVTHAYLEARIALNRAQMATEPAYLDAIVALAAKVKAECPGVLVGAPRHVKGEKANLSEVEISDELASATFGAGEHVERTADVRFESTVRRLRWSNPRVTLLLRSLAIEQAEQAAIAPPDLCSDLKFWVASAYTATSAATKQFLHRHDVVSSITQIEVEPHEPVGNAFRLDALVAYRLKPYENHADRLLAHKALPREPKLTDPALRPFFEAVGSVYAALGRTPGPVT
jgi:hypothetical protein